MSDTPRHIPGYGCVCCARDASECGCENVDWRSSREVELERENTAMTHAADSWLQKAMEWSRENADLRGKLAGMEEELACSCNAEELRQTRAERDESLREAKYLATSIWKHDYKPENAEFRPLDTVSGILSQISNMYAGMREERDTIAAENARLKEELETVCQQRDAWAAKCDRTHIGRTEAENVRLKDELDDWHNALAHVEADHPDEHHCGCVAVLRKGNTDLRESMTEAWKLVNAMAGQEYWQRAEDWLAENKAFAPNTSAEGDG